MQILLFICEHEYILAFFGVLLWQVEQLFVKKENRTWKKFRSGTARSMIWIGPIIVFDDELLAWYNSVAMVDYEIPPPQMYIVLGFLVDVIRCKFTAKVLDADVKPSPEGDV